MSAVNFTFNGQSLSPAQWTECMQDIQELPAKVLQWANQVRGRFNAPPLSELPKGFRGIAGHCVVARCFRSIGQSSAGYSNVTVVRDGAIHLIDTPEFVSRFIHTFDQGLFSDLVDALDTWPAAEPQKNHYTQKPAHSLIPSEVKSWFKFKTATAVALSPAGGGS